MTEFVSFTIQLHDKSACNQKRYNTNLAIATEKHINKNKIKGVACTSNCETLNCSIFGKCSQCIIGYYLDNNKCYSCQTINGCKDCEPTKKECLTCADNYYNSSNTCFTCSSKTEGCLNCDKTNGKCLSCVTGYFFENGVCNKCNKISYCESCEPTIRACTKCVIGNYLSSGKCFPCNNINGCVTCSQNEMKCNSCLDTFNLINNACQCKLGYYQVKNLTCSKCFLNKNNCKLCHFNTVLNDDSSLCDECFSPYVLINNTCLKCSNNQVYNLELKICVEKITNCVTQNVPELCLECRSKYYLRNGSCVSNLDINCHSQSKVNCEDCGNGILSNGYCNFSLPYCKYYGKLSSVTKCLMCNDGYISTDGLTCIPVDLKTIVINENFVYCGNNSFVDKNNVCHLCNLIIFNSEICTFTNNQNTAFLCSPNFALSYYNATKNCFNDKNCEIYTMNDCIQCNSNVTNYKKQNNSCVLSFIEKCIKYKENLCEKCQTDYLIVNNKCVSIAYLNCYYGNGVTCIKCYEGYSRNDDSSINNKYCVYNTQNVKYSLHTSNNQNSIIKNLECFSNYNLIDNKCLKTLFVTMKSVINLKNYPYIIRNTNKKYQIHNISNYTYKINIKEFHKLSNGNCQDNSPKGCLKCYPQYYLNSLNECVSCNNNDSNCFECFNTTYCLSCDVSTSFLNYENQCELSSALQLRCKYMIPKEKRCAVCKDGYYKDKNDCVSCDTSCAKCLVKTSCISCKDNYYNIPSEGLLCKDYSLLTNCITKTQKGCKKCEVGYYIQYTIPKCEQCPETCFNCSSPMNCYSCKTDFVLINGNCVHYTEVAHCKRAKNSICAYCSPSKKPSPDGTTCVNNALISVLIPILVLIFLCVVAIIILIPTIYLLRLYLKQKKVDKKICVFNMKKSNISFVKLDKQICTNKNPLVFEGENTNEIPIDKETRELLCVGNCSKNPVKMQIIIKQGSDQFVLRTEPKIVTLKSGFACEFEMYIKPNFSCIIDEEIACVILDLTENRENVDMIK
ncbi:hypothetical protein EIN_438050, partial [Entamoeba invadens IP1]